MTASHCEAVLVDRYVVSLASTHLRIASSAGHSDCPQAVKVVHPRWNFRMDGARHDAVCLQLAQLLRQHLLGYAIDAFLQIGETLHLTVEQMEQDDEFPTTLEQTQRRLDIDGCGERRIARSLEPRLDLLRRTYFLVRSCHGPSVARAWPLHLLLPRKHVHQ